VKLRDEWESPVRASPRPFSGGSGDRPFVFTDLKTGEGVAEIIVWIERDVLFITQ
jgi:hypothetical protein